MKDQIIPHILRDRIIMHMKDHNTVVTPKQKASAVDEIFETYLKMLNTGEKELDIYSLFFSIITNYDTSRWIRQRMTNKDEDKSVVYDFIKNHAYSTNFEVRWKKDMSSLMKWRYDQYPHIQEDLDRLIFILTGKTLIEVVEEVKQLNS